MLSKIIVTNEQGAQLSLLLEDISEGYSVKEIQGLDPVKANIVSSSVARLDGEQYQSSRREKRNIVTTLGLEPDYVDSSARSLRSRLYGFFMPKSSVRMSYYDADGSRVDISGRVESCEAPLFAKEPEATISVLCMNPDFYDPELVTFTGNSVSTIDATPILYEGTVETGIVFRLQVNRDLSEFTVYNSLGDNTLRSMEFVAPLIAGDVLEISSISGDKRATLIRGGVESSILYGVSPYTDWINLYPGINNIRVAIDGAVVPYTLEYTNKYGGL